jgi:uncharacterized protein (DUF885 family)
MMAERPVRIAPLVLLNVSFVVAALAIGPTGPSAHRQIDKIAHQAYQALWKFHPVDATRCGCHDYDGRLGNYAPARVAALRRQLDGFISQLEGVDTLRLSLDDRIDRELLVSNLKMELFWLYRFKLLERDPHFYAEECVGGVYCLLLRDFAPLPVRALRVAQRLSDVPRFIKQARANVKTPPRMFARAAIDELHDAEDFFQASAIDLGSRVPELSCRLACGAAEATAAVRFWRVELESMLPELPDSFAMGRADFDYLLATDKFLDFDSDSLLRLGENLFAQTDSAMQALRKRKAEYDATHPPQPPKDETAPAGFSKQDVLADEQAEVDSMRAWVRHSGFATVPDWVGRLQVVETPTFLRRVIPGIAMDGPAPLDEDQTGFMYIRPLPDAFDTAQARRYYNSGLRHGHRGGIVHEGFPGHFLQLSLANRNPSFVRRLQFNTCLIEGWALYCEQEVVEQGLYPPDSFPELRWLGGVRFRAARIIVDAKLHTGQMNYDDAWRFMMEKCGSDTAFFKAEVRRYCLSPSQPMSYLVGKTQLLALRDEYRRKTGDRFSLKDFHDQVLAEGSIPVSLIRRKLLAE